LCCGAEGKTRSQRENEGKVTLHVDGKLLQLALTKFLSKSCLIAGSNLRLL